MLNVILMRPHKNEEHVLGNWRKGDPRYKAAKTLADLCSSALWKLISDELGYSTEEISKQSVESTTWFLLAACSKMWEERDELKMNERRNQNSKI